MSWSSALAIRAKRKGGQVIENKQFREMTDFAPLMISMAYDPVAKSLVSLGEMPLRFRLLFRFVEAPDEMMRNRRRLQACAASGGERVGNGAALG